jgi:hypothetical protein
MAIVNENFDGAMNPPEQNASVCTRMSKSRRAAGIEMIDLCGMANAKTGDCGSCKNRMRSVNPIACGRIAFVLSYRRQ